MSPRKTRPEPPFEKPHDEVHRITEGLARVVRGSDRTKQSLENELGFSPAALSKILNGTTRLQVLHVHKILQVLQISPAAFYGWALLGSSSRAGADKLREADGLPPRVEEPDALDEERVRRILARILGRTES